MFSSVPGEEIPPVAFDFADELAHFFEYLVLGVLLLLVFKGKKILLWGAVFAVIGELHQLLIPGRECSMADVAVNLIGLLVSPAVLKLVLHLRKKRSG